MCIRDRPCPGHWEGIRYSKHCGGLPEAAARTVLCALPGRWDIPSQMCIRDSRYKTVVTAAISEDAAYRNACGHSDRENVVIEGNAAVRRAVLGSKDMELIRLYSDVPEFRQRLHREVIDETYPKLHELLRPLSQEDIDTAICAWNGNIESKHAVVRYMKDHAREKDTAAWLAPVSYTHLFPK